MSRHQQSNLTRAVVVGGSAQISPLGIPTSGLRRYQCPRGFERRQGQGSYGGASTAAERPRDHLREFFLPERITVRSDSLAHDDLCPCVAQRVCPSRGVVEEERL